MLHIEMSAWWNNEIHGNLKRSNAKGSVKIIERLKTLVPIAQNRMAGMLTG